MKIKITPTIKNGLNELILNEKFLINPNYKTDIIVPAGRDKNKDLIDIVFRFIFEDKKDPSQESAEFSTDGNTVIFKLRDFLSSKTNGTFSPVKFNLGDVAFLTYFSISTITNAADKSMKMSELTFTVYKEVMV